MTPSTDIKLSKLQIECVRFRAAIEAYRFTAHGRSNTSWQFKHFPRDSCRQASTFLGVWLNSIGYGRFLLVCGVRDRGEYDWPLQGPENHAWLEHCDAELVIDITADQFYKEENRPVIVCRSETKLHLSFRDQQREQIDSLQYPDIYDRVVDCLNLLDRKIGNLHVIELEEACMQIVSAMGKLDSNVFTVFKNFPRGACGAASEILALHLTTLGFGAFDYVSGMNEDQITHAWLQQGDIIIDITASQFESRFGSVVITTNSRWHSQFKADCFCPRRKFSIAHMSNEDLRAYTQILKLIG